MEKFIEKNGFKYLYADDLGIPYYMTLNDRDVGSFSEYLSEDYAGVLKDLNLDFNSISTTDQVHKTNVEIVNGINKKYPETDGLIGGAGDALIIRTADCLPVALYDANHNKLALIHSGWRGTMAKISQYALGKMKSAYSTNPKDIKVHIGPGISKDAFEVERDVIEILEKSFPDYNDVYERISEKKFHLDIKEVLFRHLISLGISEKNIFLSEHCTVKDEIFHSYRREDKEDYGAMATIAMAEA